MTYQPPLPPRVQAQMPSDPFEAWLARQAVLGHDRLWLQRNASGLRQRWERDRTKDLPPPEPEPEKPYDRYSEL